MGMFDIVIVPCPECGEEREFQSKSGECFLQVVNLDECPSDVLEDVNRHSPYTCDCGTMFEVDLNTRKPALKIERKERKKAEGNLKTKMENELNYLSYKISELETEIAYYERESVKTECVKKRQDINDIWTSKNTELEYLQNIFNALTIDEL